MLSGPPAAVLADLQLRHQQPVVQQPDEDMTQAILARQRAETLSSVLYPDDRTYQGKELRLKQQHFFVSATMQVCIEPGLVGLLACSLQHQQMLRAPDQQLS